MHGLEDSGSIIGHGDVALGRSGGHGFKDFVHPFGSHGGFNKISDSNGSNEICKFSDFSFSLRSVLIEYIW